MAGVVLGIGRSIGETMAVIMVAGNQTWMPQGLFKGLRTMTANIAIRRESAVIISVLTSAGIRDAFSEL